jgi:UDP-GlcNAc:undecaprenyl-phosphate GlcNAc-1-phosphate transferase
MKSPIIAFVLALMLTAVTVPIVRRLAFRLGAVSVPGGRHIHKRAIARLGGVAVAIGLLGALALCIAFVPAAQTTLLTEWRLTSGLMLGACGMCALGAVDDVRGVRALWKLFGQVVAAVVIWSFGYRIDAVHLPLIGDLSMGIFGLPITTLWVVGIVNAINLIDGLDGLAGGVVFFAGVTNLAVALITNSSHTALVMAAMLGSVLAFLFFNFNPARIFLGDSGSYLLGLVLAATSLVGTAQKASTTVSILVPLVALGVPILDTLLSIVRRFLERRPIFSPDRGHLHHRLLDMGITHRRAVLILYGVSIALTVLAIGVSLGRSWEAGLAILAAATIMIGLVRFVGYFEHVNLVRQQRSRMLGADVERLRRLVPRLIAALGETRSAEDAVECFVELTATAGVRSLEIVVEATDEAVFRWSRSVADGQRLDLPRAQLALGTPATHAVRAVIEAERGDLSPQGEILLQVLADALAAALLRHRSPWVPATTAPSATRASNEAAPTEAMQPV